MDTKTVIDRHLELWAEGDVDRDIAENYDSEVVLFAGPAVFSGHDGVRQSAEALTHYLGEGCVFEIGPFHVHGPHAFVQWVGHSIDGHAFDGADSFMVVDGKIHLQTTHYTRVHADPALSHHRGFTHQ